MRSRTVFKYCLLGSVRKGFSKFCFAIVAVRNIFTEDVLSKRKDNEVWIGETNFPVVSESIVKSWYASGHSQFLSELDFFFVSAVLWQEGRWVSTFAVSAFANTFGHRSYKEVLQLTKSKKPTSTKPAMILFLINVQFRRSLLQLFLKNIAQSFPCNDKSPRSRAKLRQKEN